MSKGIERLTEIKSRYRLVQTLKQTSDLAIYQVEDLHRFQEVCTLKLFKAHLSPEIWQKESRILYQLNHPQIPRFRECFNTSRGGIVVYDYIEGKTSAEILTAGGSSEVVVTQLLEQLLPLLEYLHDQGISHGNLCPENIRLRQGDSLPCLEDFSQSQENVAKGLEEDYRALATTLVMLLTGTQNPAASAEIWQKEVAIGSRLNQFLAKFLPPQESLPDVSILAVAPAQKTLPLKSPPRKTFPLWGCWLQGLGWLGVVLGFGSLGWLGTKYWLTQQTPTNPPEVFTTPSPLAPAVTDWDRQVNLRERRRRLGIEVKFFQSLLDQVFAQRYPELLATEASSVQEKKAVLAAQILDVLEKLDERERQQLGRYSLEQLQGWTKQVNEIHLSSRALYDLADAAFFAAFPEEKQQPALDQPLGQVWAAFAQEVVTNLDLGDRHEEIALDTTSPLFERQGFLQAGEGQAFVVSLEAGQNLEIMLEADQATQISIYSPTGRNNLLEDSRESRWAGTLVETGFYEIIIASKSQEALSYQLNIKLN
jgi:serine/threonine-protein kinase